VRDDDDVGELLRRAVALELDDCFEFAIERSAAADDLDGGGQRWAVTASLAGRPSERVAIDVGLGAPVLEPDSVVSSQLLGFADLQPTTVRALAIEQHVAEKLHAYTCAYAGGRSSSRVKDLVDVVVIARTTEFDAQRLRHAITTISSRRAAHPVRTPCHDLRGIGLGRGARWLRTSRPTTTWWPGMPSPRRSWTPFWPVGGPGRGTRGRARGSEAAARPGEHDGPIPEYVARMSEERACAPAR
jgi:hypothetical protein